MSTWLVRLAGDTSDLEKLSAQLCSDNVKVDARDGVYYLTSSCFHAVMGPSEVLTLTTELIGIIKSIFKVQYNYFPHAEVGGINRLEDNGRITQFILPNGIRSEVRFGMSTLATYGDAIRTSQGSTILESKLAKAMRIPPAKKALRIYGLREHNWHNLYNIFEAIQSDVGSKIIDEGWATNSEITMFTQTANSEEAIGDEARHGNQRVEPPKNPMSLTEARLLIDRILENYLDSIG